MIRYTLVSALGSKFNSESNAKKSGPVARFFFDKNMWK